MAAVVLTAGLAMAAGCDDDPTSLPPPPPPSGQKFENLTQKWHVLNNLELAYNKRNISQYNKILDANFTFFFSSGDVGGGLPEQWGRVDEIDTNTRLFDLNPPAPFTKCKSIEIDVEWEDSLTWVEITPGSAPAEKWYVTTVNYDYQFDMEPDTQYESAMDASAQFTVRNAGTDAAPHWQLVEMYDLGGTQTLRSTAGTATQASTWGRVKALYR